MRYLHSPEPLFASDLRGHSLRNRIKEIIKLGFESIARDDLNRLARDLRSPVTRGPGELADTFDIHACTINRHIAVAGNHSDLATGLNGGPACL